VHRVRLPLVLLIAALVASGCGASGLADTEPAVDAPTTASDLAVAAEPAGGDDLTAPNNAAVWAEIDAAAKDFAGHYDAATQSVASCETAAAAGEDFTSCLGSSFLAVAEAEDQLIARVDGVLPLAVGACRTAAETMRAAASQMAAVHRDAVGIRDLTSMETHYLHMGDAASAYADTAVAAGAACAG